MSESVRLSIPVGESDWITTEDRGMLADLRLDPNLAIEYGLHFWEDCYLSGLEKRPDLFYDKMVGEVAEMLDPIDGHAESYEHQTRFAQRADQFACMMGRHAQILSSHLSPRVFHSLETRPESITLLKKNDHRTIVQVNYED